MRSWTRVRAALGVALLAVSLLSLPVAAQSGDGMGGGGGGSGGDGGGGGGGMGSAYADLLVLYRDVNGLPILSEPDGCLQPVANVPVPDPLDPTAFLPTVTNPVDGSTVTLIPLVGSTVVGDVGAAAAEGEVEPCDVLVTPEVNYTVYLREVEPERLNLGRTTESVLASKLDTVVAMIEAGTELSLDSAGRIAVDGVAIDAAPEQQAIRQSLLETGTIPGQSTPMTIPPFDEFELSAAALGAAAGKEVPISVDTVVYHDRVLGLTADRQSTATWTPLVHPILGESFVDYGGFTYSREATYPGCLTYLDIPEVVGEPSVLKVDRYLDVVPFGTDTPATSNVAGYAQLADDAREVVLFTHDNYVYVADTIGENTCAQQLAGLDDIVLPPTDDPSDPPDDPTDPPDGPSDPPSTVPSDPLTSPVTVPETATTEEPMVTALPGDVVAGSTHSESIRLMIENGWMTGYPDGTFRPDGLMTRAQIATTFARMLQIGLQNGEPPFPDVPAGSTHEQTIRAMVRAEYMYGFTDGKFRPDARVIRAQAVATLARIHAWPPSEVDPFSDVAGTTHAALIRAAVAAGVAEGYPDGTFQPGGALTRAQGASLLARIGAG